MTDSVSPELLSALCHELRGPLGALGNWVHVLTVPEADASVRARALSGLKEDVHAMSVAIDQVSALASVLSGPTPTPTAIDADSFLKSLIDAAPRTSGPGTVLRTSEGSLRVLGDAARLREMLWLFLADSPPASELALTEKGDLVIFTLTLDRPPRSLPLALIRALAEQQGGGVLPEAADKPAQLRFQLRRAP